MIGAATKVMRIGASEGPKDYGLAGTARNV